MSTLQDMNSYLWKECPEEFLKLPTTDQFTFVDTPQQLVSGDTGDKLPEHLCGFQLRLGLSDGAYTTGKVVYICLGGRGHNEVLLSCEAKLFKFTLDNLANVLLDEPFRKLLGSETDAEVLNTNEKGRLKAWACYLFLSAGHVPTLPQYPRSQDDLRHACTWIVREYGVKVRTARQKAAVQRKKEKAAKSRVSEQIRSDSSADGYNYEGFADFRSRATTSGTRDQSTNTAEESRVSGFKRENDDDESDNTHSRLSKKRKIDQSLSILRQSYESLGLGLDAFEREHTNSGKDIETMRQLEYANSQHLAQIAMLERQLHLQGEETERLQAASREMEEKVRVSAQNAEKERAAREAEAALRKKAEDRLTEYMDAQRKMAARFG